MILLQAAEVAAKPETIGLGSLILAGGWPVDPVGRYDLHLFRTLLDDPPVVGQNRFRIHDQSA